MSALPPIRVLVVDDSAFARKVIRETLSANALFEVVGIARDGLEALERISELKPDVVTLDLVMPNLDGLGVLRALPINHAPRVVVVSMADGESELGIAALAAGAIDIVHKPTSLATGRLYELAEELVSKVQAAAGARLPSIDYRPSAPMAFTPSMVTSRSILAIGASTGGPQALTRLLKQMPANFPVPVVLVLHMPRGYTASFAARLDDESELHVLEATDGLVLRPGMAVVGRAGIHFKVERRGDELIARLDVRPLTTLHTPSVDVLFESAAAEREKLLAVVLTGMGEDGLAGARKIRALGGTVLTEGESSCVVYGMPRAVAEAGLSSEVATLEEMSNAIVRHL
ncbi:MAG: protein-glutamate methylesterase [Myxococcales bacterium]|nr:protein-glutamate methylesterase [Myxococcales bacterium]